MCKNIIIIHVVTVVTNFIFIHVGIGLGLSLTPSLTMVGLYFDKRYSLANGLAYSGSGVGILVLAPVAQVFIDTYGWRGSLLLLGALCLHVTTCGALLHPLRTRSRTMLGTKELKYTQCTTSESEDSGEEDFTLVRKENCHTRIINDSCEAHSEKTVETTTVDIHDNSQSSDEVGKGTVEEQKENCHRHFGGEINKYLPEKSVSVDRDNRNEIYEPLRRNSNEPEVLAGLEFDHETKESDSKAEKGKTSEKTENENENNLVSLLGLSLFKEVPFLILMVAQFCGRFSYMGWLLYLVPNAEEKGLAPLRAAFVASVAGLSNIVARATHGLLVDHNILTAAQLLTIASFGSAVPLLLAPVLNSNGQLIVGSLLFGLFSGVFHPIAVVVIKETIGLERFPNALGWSYGFAGVGRMSAGYLTGMNQLVTDALAIEYNYTVDFYFTLQDIARAAERIFIGGGAKTKRGTIT